MCKTGGRMRHMCSISGFSSIPTVLEFPANFRGVRERQNLRLWPTPLGRRAPEARAHDPGCAARQRQRSQGSRRPGNARIRPGSGRHHVLAGEPGGVRRGPVGCPPARDRDRRRGSPQHAARCGIPAKGSERRMSPTVQPARQISNFPNFPAAAANFRCATDASPCVISAASCDGCPVPVILCRETPFWRQARFDRRVRPRNRAISTAKTADFMCKLGPGCVTCDASMDFRQFQRS